MIVIFDDLHVVKRISSMDKLVPLAFVVPQDGSAARKKQIQTARNWAGEFNEVTLKNTPRSGFKVSKSVRRGWTNNNVLWRITDPENFEFEIPSENMAQIICSVGVSPDGEIPVPCIYGRDGKTNVLLPEGTEFFKNSVTAQEAKQQTQKQLADLRVGQVMWYQTGPNEYIKQYLGQVLVTFTNKEKPLKYHCVYSSSKSRKELRLSRGFNITQGEIEPNPTPELPLPDLDFNQFVGISSFNPYRFRNYKDSLEYFTFDKKNYYFDSPEGIKLLSQIVVNPHKKPDYKVYFSGNEKVEFLKSIEWIN